MNRTRIAAILLSIAPLLPAAFAKDPAPSVPPGTSEVQLIQASPKPPTRANQDAAANVDARHCLDFPTDLQVIMCAEKYRPHKRKS